MMKNEPLKLTKNSHEPISIWETTQRRVSVAKIGAIAIIYLCLHRFNNLGKIAKIRCPVLMMHGQADTTIPIHHGRSLYEAAPEPKMSLWIAGVGHNDFSEVAGDRHRQALLSFQRLIATRSGAGHLQTIAK